MSLVTLYETLHGTEIQVDREDALYRNFFDSLKEATGSVPDRLEVPSYVLEQYPALLRLLDWMSYGPLMFSISEEGCYPSEWLVERAIGGDFPRMPGPPTPGRRDFARLLPASVALADVSRIMQYLVECDPRWILYVYVDGRTPVKERMDYYRTVGCLVTQLEIRDWVTVNGTQLFWNIFSYGETDEVKNLLLGVRHGLVLQFIKSTPSWTMVNWEDMAAISSNPACYAYAGLPLPSPPELSPKGLYCSTIRIIVRMKASGYYVLELVDSPMSPLMYDRALTSLTDEGGHSILPPILFGLSPLLKGGRYTDIDEHYPEGRFITTDTLYGSVDIFSFMALIHLNVIYHSFRRKSKYLDKELSVSDFPDIIECIASHLGEKALRVIVATLLHYASHDEQAVAFCSLSGDRKPIEGRETFLRLPE